MAKKKVNWSSEAHKAGIVLPKPLEEMTEDEIRDFRNSLDCDSMGFDGVEYPGEVK